MVYIITESDFLKSSTIVSSDGTLFPFTIFNLLAFGNFKDFLFGVLRNHKNGDWTGIAWDSSR